MPCSTPESTRLSHNQIAHSDPYPAGVISDVPNVALTGDKYYRPMWKSDDMADYTGAMMFIHSAAPSALAPMMAIWYIDMPRARTHPVRQRQLGRNTERIGA